MLIAIEAANHQEIKEMKIKLIRFREPSEYIEQAINIRKEVFVVEQEIDQVLEFDGKDHLCDHYLCFVNDVPVATGRTRRTEEGLKLERFAVLKDYRNMGLGKLILDRILKDEVGNYELIYLNSQSSAKRFYLKNGFSVVGELFYEAGIEHYKMVYDR